MTQAQLAVDALATVRGNASVRADLSYLGSAFQDVGVATYEMAAGGLALDKVRQLGVDAMADVGVAAVSILPQVLSELGASVAGVAGVADFIPIVGQVLSGVLAASASMSQAYTEQSRINCQRWGYEPAHPSRAKLYGGLLPTDTMHSTAGQLFRELEGNYSVVDYGYGTQLVKGGSKIPPAARDALRRLSDAIKAALDDPESDGGMALWPVYLDLMHAQFRKGRMTWKLAQQIYACKVLPPFLSYGSGAAAGEHVPCGCAPYEQRAYREVVALLEDWQQTLEPRYTMDRPKADALQKEVQAALVAIRAGGRDTLAKRAGRGIIMQRPKSQKTAAVKRVEAAAQPVVVGLAVGAVVVGAYKLGGWKALLGLLALPP